MVLKTDVMGRMKTPAVRRQSLLEEFDRSGLSGAKFAELAGIKYSTFAGWLHLRRRQNTGGIAKAPVDAAKQMRWLEAVIEQAHAPAGTAGSALLLQLPGGARLEVTTANQAMLAAVLLKALDQHATPC
jgi:hypothetical protein